MKGRRLATAGAGLMALAVALLFLLRELPYSSVRLAAVDAAEARTPPAPDVTLGPLRWPVTALAQNPALGPFRDAMRKSCGDARGLAAAACATSVLAQRTPFGNPSSEYVNSDFDPVDHLERHLAGEPGHCLTRSSILATELLAVGTPARVLQMVPARGRGHTLVEVWDDVRGWTVVDPSNGGFVSVGAHSSAAADLLNDPASLEWYPFGSAAISPDESRAKQRYFQTLLTGNLLYPEPWLYVRQGERVAPWPFRGHYARVGPTLLALGPLQQLLVGTIPALLLAGAGLVVVGWRRRRVAATHETAWPGQVRAGASTVDGLDTIPPG